jgi:hypothetical protein
MNTTYPLAAALMRPDWVMNAASDFGRRGNYLSENLKPLIWARTPNEPGRRKLGLN